MISKIAMNADRYLDSAISLLSELISYKSVSDTPSDGMPYGKGCADVLSFAADTLAKDGFIVRNFNNHAITASFDGRPAQVGILCHLDVVPTAGQLWHSDPFKATIRDGKIFGRGAIDDKGPAAAVITAMRMIRDSGIKPEKNVRLILGCNEENGSADMKYYTKIEQFPPMLFTPDGSFPVITAEKGMVRYNMSAPFTDDRLLSLKGGSVYNAVPENASAEICGFDISLVREKAAALNINGIIPAVDISSNNTICISIKGKAVHASTPGEGKNAVTALIRLLSLLFADSRPDNVFSALDRLFPFGEYDGHSAGMDMRDDISGELTLVPSIFDLTGGLLSVGFDCRFPVSFRSSEVIYSFEKAAKAAGMTGKTVLADEPHHADENGKMVRTLLSVYSDFTGKEGKCLAIGGGTYVHDTKDGVAFGAEWSDENNMHAADEFIGVDELKKDIAIYTEAILRLSSLGGDCN